MARRLHTITLRAALGLIAFSALVFSFVDYWFVPSRVHQESHNLEAGMPKEKVRSILGAPTFSEGDRWTYRPEKPGWVTVYFQNGVVYEIDREP